MLVESLHEIWAPTKTELADGFYRSKCLTLRVLLDHFAIGTFVSFMAVGLLTSVFWHQFITGEGRQRTVCLCNAFFERVGLYCPWLIKGFCLAIWCDIPVYI